MSSQTVLLIVDDNEADVAALQQALAEHVNVIHTAPNPAAAMQLVSQLSHVSAMIAVIPDEFGDSIFDFRDQVHSEQGKSFGSVFCSRNDMSPYYGRVLEADKLFFKPIEIPVLKEWLYATAGPPLAGQNPQPEPQPQHQPEQQQVAEPPVEQQPPPQQQQAGAPQAIENYLEDLPVGIQLGDYRLDRIIQRDNDFALYEAEQTSISRKVAIKTLYRKHRADPVWVQAFVSEASARARVNHPNVSLVYECIQESGVNFYTLELVDAPSLADLAAQRANLSDETLWAILESCSSALDYFQTNQMQHRIITPQTILLQSGDQTRIANPVKSLGAILSPDEEYQQMQYLGTALKPFIRKGSTDPSLYSLIDRMGQDRIDGIKTVAALRNGLNADSEAKTTGLSDSRKKEITVKDTNQKAIVLGGLIGALLVIGGSIAASIFLKQAPEVRSFDSFSKIPAGPFPYQDGDSIELPDFWMAQQEVSIGQYAQFLDDVSTKPTTLSALQHPDQPDSKKSHKPLKWTLMHEAAMKGKKFQGAKIDPNYPVMGVDWWDAYTYARWKNARLPTEREWEKAARGRSGNVYPWGNELDLAKFNSGSDQKESGDKKAGSIDGYQFWSPVDALDTDMSRYAVTGMAGNVSEWTGTWDSHPDSPDKMVPIKRGASFATDQNFESSRRRAAEEAEEQNYFTGFRIVSDVEPGTDSNYKPAPPQRIAALTSGAMPKGGGKGRNKGPGKAKTDKRAKPAATPAAAPSDWDPKDGTDPFSTIFATPAN